MFKSSYTLIFYLASKLMYCCVIKFSNPVKPFTLVIVDLLLIITSCAQKTIPTRKNLYYLRKTVRLEKKMGEKLGRSKILQRKMPAE